MYPFKGSIEMSMFSVSGAALPSSEIGISCVKEAILPSSEAMSFLCQKS